MSYNKVPPDPTGGGGGGSGDVTDVTAGDADISVANSGGPAPAVSLVGVNGVAKATVAAGAALGATAVQPGTSPSLAGLTVTNGANGSVQATDAASYFAARVNPATAGSFRCANASGVFARNAANTANIRNVQVDASDQLLVGENTAANVIHDVAVAGSHFLKVNGATVLTVAAALVTVAALKVSSLGAGIGHYDGSGNLTSATIVNADVDAAAGIVSTKLAAAVQTSLGKADTSVQPSTAVTLTALTIAQVVATSGSPNAVVVTGAAHTTLAASVEASDLDLNLARTVQFATGALATQRAVRVRAPTYGFVGASTLTTAATLSISGAPVAGTNATITNAYALYIEAGALAMGAAPSPSGDIRLSHASSIKGNNNAGGTSKTLIDWGVTTADTLIFGGADSNIRINAVTAGSVALQVNSTTILSVVGNGITVAQSNIQFTSAATTPTISQATTATASVTGAAMALNAQDCSGTTSVTGAKLTIRAGDATGGSGTRNGGGLDIRAGTGATSNGLLRLLDSATVRLTVSSVGLGLYATTPVAQATRVGQLTDSTTGTPSTTLVDVGVAFSQSNVNNNFASLLAKHNALELACHNLGVTA